MEFLILRYSLLLTVISVIVTWFGQTLILCYFSDFTVHLGDCGLFWAESNFTLFFSVDGKSH